MKKRKKKTEKRRKKKEKQKKKKISKICRLFLKKTLSLYFSQKKWN